MAKRILFIIFGVIFSLNGIASAEETPQVKVTPPKDYTVKKVLLFPLDLPSYAVRAATLPIGVLLRLMEKKHAIEKTMDFLSNKEKTFWVYPIIEGGAGSGFGGGVGLRHTNLFHKNYLLGAAYRIHLDMSQKTSVSFGKPEAFSLFSKPVSYSFGADWNRSLLDNFFGLGNSSSKDNQAKFAKNNISGGATLAYGITENFTISPHFGISAGDSSHKGGGSSSPSVETIFSAGEIAGFNKWIDYANIGVRLAHDTRDNIEAPSSGGLRALTFRRFQGINRSGFDYNNYEFEVRQYFRLWLPRQVLLIRTKCVFKNLTGEGEIPFWDLSVLDAGSPLRGFQSGRFRDRNSLLFNAEYRFPVWNIVDGVIFYDTGRVFHEPHDISLAHIKYSIGGGLNFRIPNLVLFHFHAAYGGEGINFMFGASKPL